MVNVQIKRDVDVTLKHVNYTFEQKTLSRIFHFFCENFNSRLAQLYSVFFWIFRVSAIKFFGFVSNFSLFGPIWEEELIDELINEKKSKFFKNFIFFRSD